MSEKTESKEKKTSDTGAADKAKAKKGKRDAAGNSNAFQVESGRAKASTGVPRLRKMYMEKVVPALVQSLSLKNPMQVPRIQKVVVSACVKDALQNPKILDGVLNELAFITGQKPKVTKAKKSIATFKLRAGQSLGLVVTLRRARMYEFLDRLINVALPRVRDFKGINSRSFDGRGNYSMGIKEHIIFPEINYDRVDKIRGFNITIATSATSNDHARALLAEMGMPFRKN